VVPERCRRIGADGADVLAGVSLVRHLQVNQERNLKNLFQILKIET